MKRYVASCLLAVACGCPALAEAQLQLLASPEPQCVFAGAPQSISVTFSNSGNLSFDAPVQVRLFQVASATVAPLSIQPWKRLEILPGQTVLESAQLDFPAVNAGTKFLVEWLVDTNHIIGTSEARVYPTNLLAELGPMTGDEGPGIFDPQNELKPLLKNLKLDFTDLEDSGLENFSGKLAIIGPFASKPQVRSELRAQIKALAKKGAAVVWLLPPPEKPGKLAPSFYSVMENTNAVVVVQADQVSRLPDNPQAQLNLIYFCKLALRPVPPALPDLSPQP